MPTDLPVPDLFTRRARLAALTRHRGAEAPEVVALRGEVQVAALVRYVRRVLDQAPPLTPEQRRQLVAEVLTPGAVI
jgi:hypothetical protein